MIEVVIRHIDEHFGLPIGEFYPSDLNDIVEAVKKWGCVTSEHEAEFVSARFVSDKAYFKKAHFEIVVGGRNENE